ncbi:unnamed protein product [Vitrella brassicaformis CCMP3155]|uniref:Uncharacterized protein n=1 Tax=Vitrella brassicaformis (strain CCMP3155) TaxID=1169540 RepID=A0A0G4FGU0_VITBC|nr:unnamed protein product [Vitrella brassicaformis CCMP3155]|eukprot:CEM12613.1 unnamed protein product [Vitrella brassicaformis CCMP3155]
MGHRNNNKGRWPASSLTQQSRYLCKYQRSHPSLSQPAIVPYLTPPHLPSIHGSPTAPQQPLPSGSNTHHEAHDEQPRVRTPTGPLIQSPLDTLPLESPDLHFAKKWLDTICQVTARGMQPDMADRCTLRDIEEELFEALQVLEESLLTFYICGSLLCKRQQQPRAAAPQQPLASDGSTHHEAHDEQPRVRTPTDTLHAPTTRPPHAPPPKPAPAAIPAVQVPPYMPPLPVHAAPLPVHHPYMYPPPLPPAPEYKACHALLVPTGPINQHRVAHWRQNDWTGQWEYWEPSGDVDAYGRAMWEVRSADQDLMMRSWALVTDIRRAPSSWPTTSGRSEGIGRAITRIFRGWAGKKAEERLS